MLIWYLNLIFELVKITTEKKFTCQAGVSKLLQQVFEYKQETLVTEEIRKMIKLKTQTIRRQSWRLCLEIKFCRLCCDMTIFRGYSIGNAQIDDEIKQKIKFSNLPKFHYQPIGQQVYSTTEEIMFSLTRLPSTTYSLLSPSLLL